VEYDRLVGKRGRDRRESRVARQKPAYTHNDVRRDNDVG
jgi:hypothetical protein